MFQQKKSQKLHLQIFHIEDLTIHTKENLKLPSHFIVSKSPSQLIVSSNNEHVWIEFDDIEIEKSNYRKLLGIKLIQNITLKIT